jgi:hypothetical protein
MTMTAMQADDFVRTKMRPRWPNWKPTPDEVGDWCGWVGDCDADMALAAVREMLATSSTIVRPVPAEFRRAVAKLRPAAAGRPVSAGSSTRWVSVALVWPGDVKPAMCKTIQVQLSAGCPADDAAVAAAACRAAAFPQRGTPVAFVGEEQWPAALKYFSTVQR